MYYLDFHGLYRQTTTDERISVRSSLQRDSVMEKKLRNQHSQCFYCGTEIDMSGHLDHIIPVYYGGDNRLRNLVAACRSCNMVKLTDQIEITNPNTIKDYLKLQRAYDKLKGKKYAYKDKRYRLYRLYRADLFKYTA